MISAHYSVLLIAATTALALEGHADAAPCDADNYSKIASAVQTLHANCASWAAYLASGGVWTCDSTCHDAVTNLVNTLPECTFGGPYGQNYKDVWRTWWRRAGVSHRLTRTQRWPRAPQQPLPVPARRPRARQLLPAIIVHAPTATTGNPSTNVNNIRSDNTADESTSAMPVPAMLLRTSRQPLVRTVLVPLLGHRAGAGCGRRAAAVNHCVSIDT